MAEKNQKQAAVQAAMATPTATKGENRWTRTSMGALYSVEAEYEYMRWSWRLSGGARKVVSCDGAEDREEKRRKGWRKSEMRRATMVQSMIRKESRAQGRERKSCSLVS